MRPGRTEEALDIVWTDDEGQNIRKGVNAYAFFVDPNRQSAAFPVSVWPAGTKFESSRLTDENWVVIMWTILPGSWPEPGQWCPTLERTLKALSNGEAAVAWCALEGSFEVPPGLFDADATYDGVYAMLVSGRFACSAQLGSTFEPLSRGELTEFMRLTNQRLGPPRAQPG
jgi:hypothetical protein